MTDVKTITVRAPADLIARLAELAAANDRSLNAEIVRRLRETLDSNK